MLLTSAVERMLVSHKSWVKVNRHAERLSGCGWINEKYLCSCFLQPSPRSVYRRSVRKSVDMSRQGVAGVPLSVIELTHSVISNHPSGDLWKFGMRLYTH